MRWAEEIINAVYMIWYILSCNSSLDMRSPIKYSRQLSTWLVVQVINQPIVTVEVIEIDVLPAMLQWQQQRCQWNFVILFRQYLTLFWPLLKVRLQAWNKWVSSSSFMIIRSLNDNITTIRPLFFLNGQKSMLKSY